MSQGFDDVQAGLNDAKQLISEAAHRLENSIRCTARQAHRRLEAISCRLQPAHLGARVAAARTRFSVMCAERDAAMSARLDDARARLAVAVAELDAMSPLAVLKRGYALAQDERGRLLRESRAVQVGDAVRLRLAEGVLRCRVEGTEDL